MSKNSSPTPVTTEVTQVLQSEVDQLADENVDSTDNSVRYAAYGARLRTALRASSRYIAYTSDIGEAFRPVIPPYLVSLAYGISWLYLSGDVGYETYKAHRQGPTPLDMATFADIGGEKTRLSFVAVQRATFQSIASMALPAFTIHTAVHQATKAFANVKNPRVKMWGPTMTGLALVPGLPYIFDHPVEHVTDKAFEWIKTQIVSRDAGGGKYEGKKEL